MLVFLFFFIVLAAMWYLSPRLTTFGCVVPLVGVPMGGVGWAILSAIGVIPISLESFGFCLVAGIALAVAWAVADKWVDGSR